MLEEFEDAPAFQWMTKSALEKGIAIGKEEGKEEGRLLNQRETLVLIVEERFPDLRALAEQQVRLVNNIERLKTLARQLVVVQDTNRARQLLVEAVGH